MTLTVTILGCGSSGGVPRPGSGWGACDPAEPKNRRRRCSILVERHGLGGTTSVLIDTTPDLREQLLSAEIDRLDATLFSHDHADHTHGIDDLRALVLHMRKRIPVHADAVTGATLRQRFAYLFETPPGSDYPRPRTAQAAVGQEWHLYYGTSGALVRLAARLNSLVWSNGLMSRRKFITAS